MQMDLIHIFLSRNVIKIAPVPYIGQYGPTKNPLFINLLYCINFPITSMHHPANEYVKNNKKYTLISIPNIIIFLPPFIVKRIPIFDRFI